MAACEPRSDGVPVARRFELYLGGLEIANAYLELTDAEEQERRLRAGLEASRAAETRPSRSAADPMPGEVVDQPLLAALRYGLPESSGVALGIDRLLMAIEGASSIEEVLPFPIPR